MESIKPEYIKHWINDKNLDVTQLRQMILFFLFLFGDVFIVLTSFADPFEAWYPYTVIPPILLLHPFALWIALNPYKRQVQAFLYLGLFSIVTAFGFLIITHKILYNMMKLESPLFMIALVLIFLLYFYFFIRWHLQRLRSGYYYSEGKAGGLQNTGNYAYLGFGAVGIFIGHLIIGYTNGMVMFSVFAGAAFVLSIISGMFFFGLHKYLLIRQHPDWYVPQQPYRARSTKKERAAK